MDANVGIDFTPTKLRFDLPPLPGVVRYYDDFDDCARTIHNLHRDAWDLLFDGAQQTFSFTIFDADTRLFLKHWCVYLLSRDLAPLTVRIRLRGLRKLTRDVLVSVLNADPEAIEP